MYGALAPDSRETILTAAANPVIGQAYAQTHCHLHILRLYPKDIDSAGTVEEHRRIAEAIGNADPEAAENAMADRIKSSFKQFARAFGTGAGATTLGRAHRPPSGSCASSRGGPSRWV